MTPATDATFDHAVQHGLVLLDFWARWCMPCRALAPILESLNRPGLRIISIDVDTNPGLVSRFSISTLPTLLLLRDGAVIGQRVGMISRAQIETFIGEAPSCLR